MAILLEQARRLAGTERERNEHADTRAGGLAILANGLLVVGATLGARIADFTGSPFTEGALPVLLSLGLLLLLLAGVSAALALRLTAAPAFRASEVGGWRGERVQRAEPLKVQQRLLTNWIAAVAAERLTYDAKLRHLRRGYAMFVLGLVALVTIALTLAEGGS